MSDEGLAMVGNELGFLWDDQQNQFSWANLSTNNSENTSGGGGGEAEEEDKSAGQNKMLVKSGGPNGNYKKAAGRAGAGSEGPASNRKRGRGAVCKKNNIILDNNNKNNKNKNSSDGVKKVGGTGESDDHEIHIWTERERRKKMRNMFANLHALLPQLPPKADKSTIVDEAVNYIKTLEQTFKELKKRKFERLQGIASTSTSPSPSPSPSPTTTTNQYASGFTNYYEPISPPSSMLLNHQQNYTNKATTITTNSHHHHPPPAAQIVAAQGGGATATFQTWTSSNVVLNISGNDAHINVCAPKKPGLFTSICYALEKNKISVVSAQLTSNGARNMYMIHAHANTTGANSDLLVEGLNSVEEVFKRAVGEIIFWISS